MTAMILMMRLFVQRPKYPATRPGDMPTIQAIPAAMTPTVILDVPCRIEIDPAREELDAWKDITI